MSLQCLREGRAASGVGGIGGRGVQDRSGRKGATMVRNLGFIPTINIAVFKQ